MICVCQCVYICLGPADRPVINTDFDTGFVMVILKIGGVRVGVAVCLLVALS